MFMMALLLAGTIVVNIPKVTTIDFNKTAGEGEPEFDLEALLEKIEHETPEAEEVTIISFEGYDDDEKEQIVDALWEECDNTRVLLEKVDDKLVVLKTDGEAYEDLEIGSSLPLDRFTPVEAEPEASAEVAEPEAAAETGVTEGGGTAAATEESETV